MSKSTKNQGFLTELEKAKKKYWYDHSFDKSQNHWDAHVELSIFAEGWKQALEWIRRELYEVRTHGFEPDLGLYDMLKQELGETENEI